MANKKPIEISFDKRTVGDTKDKLGVYHTEPTGNLSKKAIYIQVERAFREYVMSHKFKHITPELCDESWKRFEPYLRARLG